MPRRSPDLLLPLLAAGSPVTFEQLQQALLQASPATTFRYLRRVRYLRSYNHNGRFYTARDPQRFDRFGLLSLGDVHFSRDGSLAATVQRLLAASEHGCTVRELRDLLHVSVQPCLLAAVRQGRARRERLAAARAADPASGLDPGTVIAVLLVLVRHPGSRPGQAARRLQGRSPPIGLAQVQAVFERFDLHRVAEKGGSGAS